MAAATPATTPVAEPVDPVPLVAHQQEQQVAQVEGPGPYAAAAPREEMTVVPDAAPLHPVTAHDGITQDMHDQHDSNTNTDQDTAHESQYQPELQSETALTSLMPQDMAPKVLVGPQTTATDASTHASLTSGTGMSQPVADESEGSVFAQGQEAAATSTQTTAYGSASKLAQVVRRLLSVRKVT